MNDDLTVLANNVRIACQRVSRRVRYDSQTALPPHMLSVLFGISMGAKTPGELADAERVSAPSMSKTIAALADQNLVTRSPDPNDGRRCLLTLTEEGKQTLESTIASRDSYMVQRLEDLSPDDRRVLQRAADILLEAISR